MAKINYLGDPPLPDGIHTSVPKISIFVDFGGPWNGTRIYLLGRLVKITAIRYIL
jgi:hypothetical protein